jgi:Protein of unknown function (DUF1656)
MADSERERFSCSHYGSAGSANQFSPQSSHVGYLENRSQTSSSSAILVRAMLNLPELSFGEVLVPWILIVGALGFLAAWLVVAIMECTGLSRHVCHLPLFFAGLIILFSSLIGMVISP